MTVHPWLRMPVPLVGSWHHQNSAETLGLRARPMPSRDIWACTVQSQVLACIANLHPAEQKPPLGQHALQDVLLRLSDHIPSLQVLQHLTPLPSSPSRMLSVQVPLVHLRLWWCRNVCVRHSIRGHFVRGLCGLRRHVPPGPLSRPDGVAAAHPGAVPFA